MIKKTKKFEPWSDAENKLLQEYYYTLRKEVLLKVFPGKSIRDIVQQVAVLEKAGKDFKGSTK